MMSSPYISRRDKDIVNKCYRPIYEFPQIAPDEIWTPITDQAIPGICPIYYVSTYCRFITMYYYEPRFRHTSKDEKGYHQLSFGLRAGGKRLMKAHRVVKLTFSYIPGCEEMEVNHEDGNKDNNHISNLTWMSHLDNMQHAIRTGLETHIFRTGEDASRCTITNVQAEQAAQLLAQEELNYKTIGEITNMNESIVKDIAYGTTHKELYQKYKLYNRAPIFKSDWLDYHNLMNLCLYFQENSKYYNENTIQKLYFNALQEVFGVTAFNSQDRYYMTVRDIYNRRRYSEYTKNFIW